MKRFLPQSLSGQIAVVMTLALLAASAVNFLFLVGERSRAGLIEMSGPPMARFVDAASEIASETSWATGLRIASNSGSWKAPRSIRTAGSISFAA